MNMKNYRDFLLSSIKPSAPAGGGSHVACRCFYCPDGKSPNSKHFYISIPTDDRTPSLYYCHKCNSSGVVTYKTLIDWGIFDPQIAQELIYHNEKCGKYSSNRKYFDDDFIYNIYNDMITDNNTTRIKLQYINDRLGSNLTYQDIIDLKIVLNLGDMLKRNHINNFTRDPNIIKQLHENFIGFLSIDNAFLNMRRICNEGLVYKSIDKRYINYNIFNKFSTTQRFYTIPNKGVYVGNPNRLKIHIAEGPFDILSIYLRNNKEEGIYTSVGGSNYIGQVINFMYKYMLPYNEFHIYPDNDKSGSRWKMNKIAEFLKPTLSPLYIHRNLYPGQKDFGVPNNKIDESIEKIL